MNYPPPPPNWQPPFVPTVSKPQKSAPPRRGLGVGAIVAIAAVAVVAVAGIVIGIDELRIWNLKRHIGNELENAGNSINGTLNEHMADGYIYSANQRDEEVAEMVAKAKAEGRSLTPEESERFTELRLQAKEYRESAAKMRKNQK